MRLYLLDFPGPFPKILAIALSAPKQDFERVTEAEAHVLELLRVPRAVIGAESASRRPWG